MNLIACSKNCLHQKNGYCSLEGAGALTQSLDQECGYYQCVEKQKDQSQTENSNRVVSEDQSPRGAF